LGPHLRLQTTCNALARVRRASVIGAISPCRCAWRWINKKRVYMRVLAAVGECCGGATAAAMYTRFARLYQSIANKRRHVDIFNQFAIIVVELNFRICHPYL